MKTIHNSLGLLLLLLAAPAWGDTTSTHGRFAAELEAGPVWQSRNDVQIPNDSTGTRFSVVDLIGSGPYPAGRLYVTWNITERHGLRLLLAPLTISGSGTPADTLYFAGSTFVPGTPADATYQFNSWRLTYQYRFAHGRHWTWWIGLTAKIRDARIQLDQGSISAQDTDVGFVPLLHIAGWYRLSDSWQLELDADALAGGPGRAIDASFKVAHNLNDRWGLSAGYRMVEGGADVDAVYNFAWLHYAVLSARYRF